MVKWLITGGLGFIGSNFIHFLINNYPEIEIVNLDVMTYAGNPENLQDINTNSQYNFIKGNICNYELVDYIIKKYRITHIVNFAAESHVDRSIMNPEIFVDSNIKGTQTLLNAAKTNKIERYLQISTDEVYGSLDFESPAFTEQNPITPHSPYAACKASADLLVKAYHDTFNLPTVITRCSNNYGAYQFPEKLIPLMIHNIQEDKPLPVYGDGSNIRDWIYVEDHCRGIHKAMIEGQDGEIYNFGGQSELSNLTLVKTLLQKLGKGEDLITFVKDRPGHDLRYAMNFQKAQAELNWNPTVNFEEGIDLTIQWYLNHQEWIDHVTTGTYQEYYQKQYSNR